MAIVTIPAALRQLIADRDLDLLDHPDPDEAVALIVEGMVQVMLDQTGIEVAKLLAAPAIVDPLGGPDYVRAVLAWRDAGLKWSRSRRRAKGLPPAPPPAPTR
jgi:hypothetical protein